MTITVKFFASLRERVGQAEASVSSAAPITVAQIWAQATSNMSMPDNTLCAINMEYVDSSQQAHDGDEVAFFPPVTGG